MKNDDISHDGHRARLLDLACNAGLDSMSDVQVVEFLLTYIFPRGDVNPLAHRLLDTYGDITHIINANVAELMTVKGLNERSAKKLSKFGDLFFAYITARMNKKFHAACEGEIIDAVEDLLRFRNDEFMLLLGFSPKNYLCGKKMVTRNSKNEVGMNVMELTAFLSSVKPHALAVAHCHPYGISDPSKDDVQTLAKVRKICYDCGVRLIDSYIVGEDGVYSQTRGIKVRKYTDVDDLRKAFETLSENKDEE